MIKKVAIIIIIGALSLGVVAPFVEASEVTGNLSTAGGSNGNATTTPDTTPGHSSQTDGSGHLAGNVQGGTDATTQTESTSITAGLFLDTSYMNNQSGGSSSAATTSDQAHLAMMDFGPRYGVPSAPDAGGSGGEVAIAATETGVALSEPGDIDDTSSIAFLPRSGEGPVAEQEITANALTSASGFSVPQLILLGLLLLILLASMGYAISRSNQTPHKPTPA